jgi:hypothetical protein
MGTRAFDALTDEWIAIPELDLAFASSAATSAATLRASSGVTNSEFNGVNPEFESNVGEDEGGTIFIKDPSSALLSLVCNPASLFTWFLYIFAALLLYFSSIFAFISVHPFSRKNCFADSLPATFITFS